MGCGVAMEGSDFTGPKLKAVDEGAWAVTDVAGIMNGIKITLVSPYSHIVSNICSHTVK